MRPLGLCALFLLIWLNTALATDNAVYPVDVTHWWVSLGEQASIQVIERHLAEQGIVWITEAMAGSGTSRYMDVVRRRVAAGNPPMASQVIGYDIQEWARQGKLANLDAIAEQQEWDEVVPFDIQHLSKYQGHWVAAPINAHSTNWLWLNQPQLSRLGLTVPDTWPDLIHMLEAARLADIIPLAIGRDAWEHTLLFESVAAGAGGAEFYRRVFLDLDPVALDDAMLGLIFQRMSQLREYMDEGMNTRSWDQGTDLVRTGQALMQVQGSWVNGEFNAHGMIPGQDFACFRFPDTQGVFLFNSDQYMFFKDYPVDPGIRNTFASTLMEVELQRELNIATGAAPARVDVPRESFNQCGQRAINDLRAANMRRTVMGSIAMGNANPGKVKEAIYTVVSDHLLGRISDAQAVDRMKAVIINAARSQGN
ncbi:carbohydrate ABC transporter substrate-binding protein, CUT1 family [Halopseudomonas salegens]|uniref:Probable sugar-binding periplasmic protein n=2 Tax=Halopseudomonas salegens TaxID=1434072 RepID=A0A1H2HEV0_9GAMM|nr:carbohydrate ABC transporter substrate-binding protein, CUT1 family [Halopseudomonas salegens]